MIFYGDLSRLKPISRKLYGLGCAIELLQDFQSDRFETDLIRAAIDTNLGTDTAFRSNIPFYDLYGPSVYGTSPRVPANTELRAALEVVAVETSREAISQQLDTLIIAPSHYATLQHALDHFVEQHTNVSPTTAIFLADAGNVGRMRARFPEAGLNDERLVAVLGDDPRKLLPLAGRQALLPRWADGKVPTARLANV